MYKVCLWRYNAILFSTWAPTFGCKFGEVFYFVLLNVTVNCHCIATDGVETCPSAILSTTNCCHYHHARRFYIKTFISLPNQMVLKLKVKGRVWGFFGPAACRPIVPLPPMSSPHSSPEAPRTT